MYCKTSELCCLAQQEADGVQVWKHFLLSEWSCSIPALHNLLMYCG